MMRAVVIYEAGSPDTRGIAEAVADGLPADPVPVITVDDVTAADIEHADLVVLGGPARRLGLSAAMRAFLAEMGGRTWRGRHVAAFDTGTVGRNRLMSMSATGEMAWRLRMRRVAVPLPRERFGVDVEAGREHEMARAKSWGKSLPIAAHL